MDFAQLLERAVIWWVSLTDSRERPADPLWLLLPSCPLNLAPIVPLFWPLENGNHVDEVSSLKMKGIALVLIVEFPVGSLP